jgi:hypothetical protein
VFGIKQIARCVAPVLCSEKARTARVKAFVRARTLGSIQTPGGGQMHNCMCTCRLSRSGERDHPPDVCGCD